MRGSIYSQNLPRRTINSCIWTCVLKKWTFSMGVELWSVTSRCTVIIKNRQGQKKFSQTKQQPLSPFYTLSSLYYTSLSSNTFQTSMSTQPKKPCVLCQGPVTDRVHDFCAVSVKDGAILPYNDFDVVTCSEKCAKVNTLKNISDASPYANQQSMLTTRT